MRCLTAMLAVALFAGQAQAKVYNVDYANSSVSFSGAHAENPFTGEFKQWTADIDFYPTALAKSHFNAEFKTASAHTGNKMYDGTLPQSDWFDSAKHPNATFKSTSIEMNDDGSYTAKGDLTIRGVKRETAFTFALSDLNASPITANGTFGVDRLAYNMGKKSDPNAEWVSKDIAVNLVITATPAPDAPAAVDKPVEAKPAENVMTPE